MPVRRAVVAGRFYPDDPRNLRETLRTFLTTAAGLDPSPLPREPGEDRPLLTMLPHAGHVYCGVVVASALAGVSLARRLVILAPNHTGRGHPLGFWPEGSWETPLGAVPVDAALGEELEALGGGFAPDVRPHLQEHDIEVLLPFFQLMRPDVSILPVVVGGAGELAEAALALAELARRHGADSGEDRVAFIVSSDMNHYAPDAENRRRDALALEAFLALDPSRLVEVVRRNHISMCGVLPALMGLLVCGELGAKHSRLTAYDTSAAVSGDVSRVVGYAGARIW